MSSPPAPHVVCRFLVVCAIALGAALFIPHWASSSGGSETKYLASEVSVGLFAVEGNKRLLDWAALGERDVEVPEHLELMRAFAITTGLAALVAMLASAYGAFRRRAPTSRWALALVQATVACFAAWLIALAEWQGFVPSYAALLALAATGCAWWALRQVPLRAELARPPVPPLPIHCCPACSSYLQWSGAFQRWWCARCHAAL